MRKIFVFRISIIYLLLFSFTYAQDQDTLANSKLNFGVETDLYFTDTFFVIPIITADKGHLHLEARYLNEEVETASVWIGYNISGGSEFEYLITPMVGGAFGRIDGVAAEMELTLNYIDFELYNDLEYLFDIEAAKDILYYSSDLSYSPLDWLWFGISGRRAKIYQRGLEIEHGLFLGVAYNNLQLTTYLFNIDYEDTFLMISFAADF